MPEYQEPALDADTAKQEREQLPQRKEAERTLADGFAQSLATEVWNRNGKRILILPDGRVRVMRSGNVTTYPAGTLHLIPPFSDGEPLPKNYQAIPRKR